MQTIGKTTNKRDFPLNWTDILFKSISGKTNYTIDVKIGTKRISTDNQDLRENPKKRRKQSNPTRISSNEENMNRGLSIDLSPDENKKSLNHIEPMNDLLLTSYQSTSSALPLNLTKSENQKLLSDKSQKIQLSNNIQQNELSAEVPKNFKYQPITKPIPNFENRDCHASESSTCMVSFKDQPCTSTANVGASSIQIFNPEAFCNQCNKEFCNKYFLKTHKANKHGVFIDSFPNSSIVDQLDKNKITPMPTTSDFSANTNDIPKGASTPLLFKSPLLFSQPLVITNTCVSKNMYNNQTRAFCSICQKEFCNKYFVKRHKAKIHGIIDDGDYKISADDVPFNFKPNFQIKNEHFDSVVSDTYDKCEKTISPSFHTQESTFDISKTNSDLFVKDTQNLVENEEPATKCVGIEIPCTYIKVEEADNEQNMIYTNQSPNDSCNLNNLNDSELTSYSANIINQNYEHSAVYRNEYSTSNVENTMEKSTEFKSNVICTPINLITNNTEHVDSKSKNINEIKLNETNDSRDNIVVENDINDTETEKNTITDNAKNELIDKSKLLTVHNLFFKLNGSMLGNISKCFVCNAQVDGSLKEHIFEKHKNIVHDMMNESLELNGRGNVSAAQYSCSECQLTFNSDVLLRAHVEQCECNVKGIDRASTSSKNSAETDEYIKYCTKGEPGERKQAATVLSSFCKICNKELCNKYFMKTHMQRMHGISIQSGNHIGGVVCDICNKELCSKYFLRVHKQNSHGIMENGSCQRYWSDSSMIADNGQILPPSDEPLHDNHRYYKHYTEVCNICLRRFRSAKWLSAHLLNDHGDEGKPQWQYIQSQNAEDDSRFNNTMRATCSEQSTMTMTMEGELKQNHSSEEMKQYRCSYCPFSTSILSFLFVHEKFHVAEKTDTAEEDPMQVENPGHHKQDTDVNPNEESSQDTIGNDGFVGPEIGSSSIDHSQTTPTHHSRHIQTHSQLIQTHHSSAGVIPESNHHEPFIMQSFFLENCSVSPSAETKSTGRSDSFHSSLVYLPVKEKLTSTVNVFFKLTPT